MLCFHLLRRFHFLLENVGKASSLVDRDRYKIGEILLGGVCLVYNVVQWLGGVGVSVRT